MPVIAKTAIENRMTAMINASADLVLIKRIFVGMVADLKFDYTPCIEVMIESEDWSNSQTGGWKNFEYAGNLVITVFNQDLVTTTARIYRIPTYDAMTTYIDALIKLFSAVSNGKLQNLTFDNGVVNNVLIAQDALQYGAPRFNERDNNLFNAGIVPFLVQTNEVDTL